MILNIFLTALILFIVFTAIVNVIDADDLPNGVAYVIIVGFVFSAVTAVLSAIALVWTR